MLVLLRHEALVVVENRHGERALGAFLTNHVAVEKLIKLARRRHLFRKDFLFDGVALSVLAFGLLRILARNFNLQFRSHCANAFAAEKFSVKALKERRTLRLVAAAEGAVAFCHYLISLTGAASARSGLPSSFVRRYFEIQVKSLFSPLCGRDNCLSSALPESFEREAFRGKSRWNNQLLFTFQRAL